MSPLIHHPGFHGGKDTRQRMRDRLREFVETRGITIRTRDGKKMDVEELLNEAIGPERKPSAAALIVLIGFLALFAGWIAFVLAFRPG